MKDLNLNPNFENTAIDYSRIYPSAHCREFAMVLTNAKRRTKAYSPLTNVLYGHISTIDMSKLLLIEFRQITRPDSSNRTRVATKLNEWQYGEGKYCVPFWLADLIDEFETNFFKVTTPIVKDDYPCKKIECKPVKEEEKIPLPNGMVSKSELNAFTDSLDSFEDYEEDVIEDVAKDIMPLIIVPEGYLSDDAYNVLCKYIDCIGRKFIQRDDSKITVHNIFDIAMAIFMLGSEDIAKLKNIIIPIEKNYVTDEDYRISDLI